MSPDRLAALGERCAAVRVAASYYQVLDALVELSKTVTRGKGIREHSEARPGLVAELTADYAPIPGRKAPAP